MSVSTSRNRALDRNAPVLLGSRIEILRRFRVPPVTAVLLFFLVTGIAFGAADDPGFEPPDGSSPIMFGFVLIAFCVALFLVGVGIVVAAIVAVSVVILIALGIVSAAACIGLLRRRFSSGFRALHYQVCAVAALPAGVGALFLGAHFFTPELGTRHILVIGSAAGIGAGLLLAFAFDWLAGLAYRRFVLPSISDATRIV
jgi:hypothetical protein